MTVVDFGRFDGPVVLFADAQGNRHATQALAALINGRSAVCAGGCDEVAELLPHIPSTGAAPATFVQGERRYAVAMTEATLWPASATEAFQSEVARIEDVVGRVDGVVAGTGGIAFHRRIDRWHWINPGSLGVPPHDGRTMTRYAILEADDVMIHRLRYDHVAAAEALPHLSDALISGLWSNESALPKSLKRSA